MNPAAAFAGFWTASETARTAESTLSVATTAQTELFRVPFVVEPSTYALAALVVAVATVVSAFLVGRKINHLDLVEVLKARE